LFYYQLIASRPKDLLHLGAGPDSGEGLQPHSTSTDQTRTKWNA
jgi:hypothetical protein